MTDDTWGDHDWPQKFMGGAITRIRWAVVTSIAAAAAWISFTLLYVAFWAPGFSLFQSIVVIVVSLVLLAAVMAATWVSFGMRWAHRVFE
jgi:hypothetical protein